MVSARFTQQVSPSLSKMWHIPVKTKELLLCVCEYIKNSDLLLWTLSVKNIAGLSEDLDSDYSIWDIQKSMYFIPVAYKHVDKSTKLEIVKDELVYMKSIK